MIRIFPIINLIFSNHSSLIKGWLFIIGLYAFVQVQGSPLQDIGNITSTTITTTPPDPIPDAQQQCIDSILTEPILDGQDKNKYLITAKLVCKITFNIFWLIYVYMAIIGGILLWIIFVVLYRYISKIGKRAIIYVLIGTVGIFVIGIYVVKYILSIFTPRILAYAWDLIF